MIFLIIWLCHIPADQAKSRKLAIKRKLSNHSKEFYRLEMYVKKIVKLADYYDVWWLVSAIGKSVLCFDS